MKREEAAFEKMIDDWCSGCEVCQFEGDGSCAPKVTDTYARQIFDAGYQAGSEGRWVPIRSVKDLPLHSDGVGRRVLWLTKANEVYAGRLLTVNSEALIDCDVALDVGRWDMDRFKAWAELPPAYKED